MYYNVKHNHTKMILKVKAKIKLNIIFLWEKYLNLFKNNEKLYNF